MYWYRVCALGVCYICNTEYLYVHHTECYFSALYWEKQDTEVAVSFGLSRSARLELYYYCTEAMNGTFLSVVLKRLHIQPISKVMLQPHTWKLPSTILSLHSMHIG